MRKVSIFMIKPDMRLAKSIYYNNRLLVSEGTSNLNRFITTLSNKGIYYIYIQDSISEDIDIPEGISDQTRFKCRRSLADTFEKLHVQGMLDTDHLFGEIDGLLEEITNRPDILVSLTDIGTTDDSVLIHSVNTTIYALLMGYQMGYSKVELRRLAEGALLHDIGKTLVQRTILQKPGSLTFEEFEHMKTHSLLGYEMVKKNPLISELSRLIVLSHHERLDGSGYPYGLFGEDIHDLVRVVMIADVYESLTANRCYRQGLCPYDAIQIITEEAANKLDAHIASYLIKKIAIYPNGSMIRLSDHRYALVKEQNNEMPYRPIVRVIGYENGKEIPLEEIDLMKELNLTISEPNVIKYKPENLAMRKDKLFND